MSPVALVLAAFSSFLLGFFFSPGWFVACAVFLAAYAIHLARWLFSRPAP